MLKQYQRIKNEHKDCILFFRLGDFYEMFYDDARTASRILGLVLTSRGHEKSGKAPMCGIPYHAAGNYITRLIKAGQKVAICEQVEDPSQARGIVRREVIRVVTSGTYIDEETPESRYLLCLILNKNGVGLSLADASQGAIRANEYGAISRVLETIAKLPVYECLFPESQTDRIKDLFAHPFIRSRDITLSPLEDWSFNPEIARKALCEHFGVHSLKGFGLEEKSLAVSVSGALLEYLKAMNRQPLRHFDRIALYADDPYCAISPAACRGLELEGLRETLDGTLTPMGRRAFRECLFHPLKDTALILERQDAVSLLKDDVGTADELRRLLRGIPDTDKNLSRLSCGYASPKDLLSLRNALAAVPTLADTLRSLNGRNALFTVNDIPALRELLVRAVDPDMPAANAEGKVIRRGFDPALDELRAVRDNGRRWLKDLQAREAERSGIPSLKVGYNRVFGYYIEITKTHLKSVPGDYIRRQTLVNAERFITPELKEFEEKILSAEERIIKSEEKLLKDLREAVLKESAPLHLLSGNIATVDVIQSLALLARRNGYVRPRITTGTLIDIKEGRHPVVENACPDPFVPNDTRLDCEDSHLHIITGPNMSGKSTYIRQTAVLVIMAQMGGFIPAREAEVGIVDKVFTRIGAHDDITKGQSTFMVEMSEAADILNNLSDRSLVVLDEIGRGTSTFDGLSLAWALAEHLGARKARTLFATHFHELTALAEGREGVKNFNVAVREWGDEIVFLHKIVPGGCDDSYGIYVAKLAGIPREVIKRAEMILTRLEMRGNLKDKIREQGAQEQLALFSPHSDPIMEDIKKELARLDLNNLTPLQAMETLQKMKERLKQS